MSAPSADMTCGHPFSCRTSRSSVDGKLGHRTSRTVSTRKMRRFLQVFAVRWPWPLKLNWHIGYSCSGELSHRCWSVFHFVFWSDGCTGLADRQTDGQGTWCGPRDSRLTNLKCFDVTQIIICEASYCVQTAVVSWRNNIAIPFRC